MDGSVESIKAALQWPIMFIGFALGLGLLGHMPFTGHVRRVTGRFDRLGNRDTPFIEITSIGIADFCTPVVDHMTDPRLVRIESCQQGGTCGTTASCIVKLSKPQATLREGVEIGSMDLAAITTYVRIANVIGHDQYDVRRRIGSENRCSNSGQKCESEDTNGWTRRWTDHGFFFLFLLELFLA